MFTLLFTLTEVFTFTFFVQRRYHLSSFNCFPHNWLQKKTRVFHFHFHIWVLLILSSHCFLLWLMFSLSLFVCVHHIHHMGSHLSFPHKRLQRQQGFLLEYDKFSLWLKFSLSYSWVWNFSLFQIFNLDLGLFDKLLVGQDDILG